MKLVKKELTNNYINSRSPRNFKMCKKFSQYLRCIKFHFTSAALYLALFVAFFLRKNCKKKTKHSGQKKGRRKS